MTALIRHLIWLIVMLFSFFLSRAQLNEGSQLFKTLKEKDSLLFDAAFNRCDTRAMEDMFTADFEFYHDKSGSTAGRDKFLGPVIEECSRRNPADAQPAKRILVDGSLQVFPLYDQGELYGAIQHGIHRFESLNGQKEYQKGDTARFTHLWVIESGQWKIKRELSYDHQFHGDQQSK